jgi:protein ImuB
VARLLAPKLGGVDPGFGIEVVTVFAQDVEPLSSIQTRMDAEAGVGVDESLAPLIDRLINRLGDTRVWRADLRESHVPERSVVRSAPLAARGATSWDPERPRPTRLLKRPEAIAVMAKLPDDPPVRFQWRNKTHRVQRAEGPERIGQEWWRTDFDAVGPAKVRDYYRVEDEAGGRYWIYRQGLYGVGDEPKWWLHGLFG